MESGKGVLPLRGSPDAQEVRQQLELILADPAFSGASRRSRLLRYLVEQALDGKPEALKESVIATEVFDRPADYDPQVDSVVRVEVGRLRARLLEYYSGPGADQKIRIEISKGGYRPAFVSRETAPAPVAGEVPRNPSRAPIFWAVALLVAASLAAWAVWRTRTTPVPAAALPPTIAVLPFLNFSGDSTDDYLGDSISEELTEALAELNDLRVVSRTSAFQYKGKNADAREIGKNLRAGAILEGSIARRGGKFHVVAQLIRTSDGYHLWSRSYDAAPADLTPVEASIARSAYETLLPTPLSVTARNDASTTRNPEAHDLYMRAVYELNLRTEASVRQSIDLARKATAADPSFARPWVAMAAGESQLNTLLAQSPHSAAERAWQDISKALELDPRNSGAHAQRAILAYTDHWDWPEAEREFRLATAGGSHGSAENLYGWCLITRGRFKEAKSRLQRASELDPLSLGPQLNQVAELVAEQDLKEARHKAEQVLSIAPRSPAVLATAALVAYRQRDCAWDTDLSRRLDEAYPHTLIARMTAVAADDLCGRPEDAKRALAAIVNDQSPGYVSPFSLATAMALSNDSEKALFYLEKSAEFREPVLMLLKVDQAFAPLRQNPRFIALERRIGLLD